MTKPVVTDHALVRYLEHVAGLNMERLRRNIHLRTKHAINSGASSITVDGYDYRLAGGRVVTVVPATKTRKLSAAKFREWDQSGKEDETDAKHGPV